MKTIYLTTLLFTTSLAMAQSTATSTELPYREIPAYPENYSPGNVISRMIDGLGYRYYWATEGLTEQDLAYQPTPEAQSAFKTLQHIHGLSEMIAFAPENKPNVRPAAVNNYAFEELRKRTLLNLQKASELCQEKSADELETFKVIFQSTKNTREFPYWNLINGPLSDALYHVGQIVSFRRTSGNPINPKVSVFLGKTSE